MTFINWLLANVKGCLWLTFTATCLHGTIRCLGDLEPGGGKELNRAEGEKAKEYRQMASSSLLKAPRLGVREPGPPHVSRCLSGGPEDQPPPFSVLVALCSGC